MGKLFGLIVIVLGFWLGMEIYTEGTKNAFDGAISSFANPSDTDTEIDDSEKTLTLPARAGSKVEQAHVEAAERRARLMTD